MGTMDDVMKDGISFTNKRNWKKDDVVEEVKVEPEEPKEPEIDHEYLARQARLEARLVTAKTVNYSGFAINGSTIIVILVGINNFIMDPNTLELINLIEKTFGIKIPYEEFVELVELWKAQIMSLCGSVQMGFMYYQQTRQRMKDADTEDTWAFINEELGKII